jgi:S-adenosylmethionine decarboxylase
MQRDLSSDMQTIVGTEWVIDAWGCDPARLADRDTLARLFETILADLALTPVGEPHWHKFPGPGGVTGLVMLTESHLACHTYPEHGVATFNLYCCKHRDTWPWAERLASALGASHVTVRIFERGAEGLAFHASEAGETC